MQFSHTLDDFGGSDFENGKICTNGEKCSWQSTCHNRRFRHIVASKGVTPPILTWQALLKTTAKVLRQKVVPIKFVSWLNALRTRYGEQYRLRSAVTVIFMFNLSEQTGRCRGSKPEEWTACQKCSTLACICAMLSSQLLANGSSGTFS